MNAQVLKEVIRWWQRTEYLEVINVRQTKNKFKFTVDLDGTYYDVSIKEVK